MSREHKNKQDFCFPIKPQKEGWLLNLWCVCISYMLQYKREILKDEIQRRWNSNEKWKYRLNICWDLILPVISSWPVRMAKIVKPNANKYWNGCGDTRTLIFYWWKCKLVWVFLESQKYFYHMIQLCLSWWASTQRTLSYVRDACSVVFIAVMFAIAKKGREHRSPPSDEWTRICGVFIEWNIILLLIKTKLWDSWINGWRRKQSFWVR